MGANNHAVHNQIIGDSFTGFAGTLAALGWIAGWLPGLVSFIVLLMAGFYYYVQIADSAWFKSWRLKRHNRRMAKLRRKHRNHKNKSA